MSFKTTGAINHRDWNLFLAKSRGTVVLLLNGDGANGSAVTENSGYNRPLTTSGATNSTAVVPPYNSSSIRINAGGFVQCANNALDFNNMRALDFTLEWWDRPDNVDATRRSVTTLLSAAGLHQFAWWISYQNGGSPSYDITFDFDTAQRNLGGPLPVVKTWRYNAISRNGTNLKLWIGNNPGDACVLAGSATISPGSILTPQGNPISIGRRNGGTEQWAGYIKDYRIVKNRGLYPTACTVPTSSLTNRV
jgi:hypothetical protein